MLVFAGLALAAFLTGCASGVVRGELSYELRSKAEAAEVLLPPIKPRYRYAGELVGEPNFASTGNGTSFNSAVKWLVGLLDEDGPVLLQRPQHGVTAEDGRVYVVDAGLNALVVFDPNPPEEDDSDGGHLMVWGTSAGESQVRFGAPGAVAIAWNGDLCVTDMKQGVVLRLTRKGEVVGHFGQGQLERPTGIAFDPARGLLYVADTVAHDVKVYDERGVLVNTIGSPGDIAGNLNAPTFVNFSDGHLYVTDTYNSRVQVFDSEGHHVRAFGERGLYVGNLARPKGIAVGNGIVYVVESYYGHLLAFNERGQFLLGIDGSGLKGDRFQLPSGVWTDSSNKVYVADMFNGRVVVFQFLGNKDE